MKVFILTVLITALTGFAGFASAQASCVGRNTVACQEARNAFAEHHGGRYPSQWYQGQQGRWWRNGNGNDWRWRSDNGREYWRGNNGWNWREAHEEREHHHHHHD